MKQSSLLPTIQSKSVVKVGSAKTNDKTSGQPTIQNLQTYEEGLEKMWQMFQTQLQRNFDLMSLVTKQQQQIEQLVSGTVIQPLSVPALKQEIPVPAVSKEHNQSEYENTSPMLCNTVPSLSYEKLIDLKESFNDVFFVKPKRLDAVLSIINFLHFLFKLDGTASREELLRKTSLSVSSLQRYSGFLLNNHLVTYQGKINSNGIFRITQLGIKFLNGELTTHNQFLEEIKKLNS